MSTRLHGNASRINPNKTFRLYARNELGAPPFTHRFFGDESPNSHSRLLLRNSGNDAQRLMLVDGYLQHLMRDFVADTQAYQPAVLFINGEYWGIHNLRERFDEHYVEATHGVDRAEVILREGALPRDPSTDPDGFGHFIDLLEDIADLDAESDEFVVRVERDLDVDSFFDWVIAHSFAGNADWPENNTRLWRAGTHGGNSALHPGDGRWRWMIFDLDHMGGGGGRYDDEYDVFSRLLAPTDDPTFEAGRPYLFHRVVTNTELRTRFLNRYSDHLNTTFHPARTVDKLDQLESLLAFEMSLHLQRWGQPTSLGSWHDEVDRLRQYMTARPGAQRHHIIERLKLDGTIDVAIDVSAEGGTVRVNSVHLDESSAGTDTTGTWVGTYFESVPVTIEALPADGWRFVRWDGMDGDARLDLTATTDVMLRPVFEPEG